MFDRSPAPDETNQLAEHLIPIVAIAAAPHVRSSALTHALAWARSPALTVTGLAALGIVRHPQLVRYLPERGMGVVKHGPRHKYPESLRAERRSRIRCLETIAP